MLANKKSQSRTFQYTPKDKANTCLSYGISSRAKYLYTTRSWRWQIWCGRQNIAELLVMVCLVQRGLLDLKFRNVLRFQQYYGNFSELTNFFGCLFSFKLTIVGAASISRECFSSTSVIPLLSASNSILNLCSSSSSLRKYRSTSP